MFAIPEIQIERVLETALPALRKQPELLDDVFGEYDEEFREEAKKFIKENEIKVVQNWPIKGMTLPLVAIVNVGDAENPSQDVLGDFLEELEANEDTDATQTSYKGIAKNGQWQIICMSDDPRLTLYVTYVVEAMLILNTDFLQEKGMHNILLNTADLKLEENMLPDFPYARMVVLSCLHYYAVPLTARLIRSIVVRTAVDDEAQPEC